MTKQSTVSYAQKTLLSRFNVSWIQSISLLLSIGFGGGVCFIDLNSIQDQNRITQSQCNHASHLTGVSFSSFSLVSQAWSRRRKQLKEDPLALARRLLQDGEPNRAALALADLDPKQEGVDRKGYERLMGLVHYRLNTYQSAAPHFKAALKLGDQDPSLFYFYARTLVELKDLKKALQILDQAPDSLWETEVAWRLKLQCIYQDQGAVSTYPLLEMMIQRFPKNREIREQRIRLLCELGLFQSASELALQDLQDLQDESHSLSSASSLSSNNENQLLAYAQILSETGKEKEASLLLEKGLLLFESDTLLNSKLRQRLAHSYLQQNRPFSAAEILFPLALKDPKHALYTSELYRRAGQVDRALWMNRLVADQKSKLKQRLTLLIEEERYEESAALLDRIQRLGLLEDEAIIYALAYAFYRVYEFPQAELLLSKLMSDGFYEKGIQLRKAIDQCRRDAWRCE